MIECDKLDEKSFELPNFMAALNKILTIA